MFSDNVAQALRIQTEKSGPAMPLEIEILETGDLELDTEFLVEALQPGEPAHVPTFSYLITGGEEPILVDTGFREEEIMQRLGMKGFRPESYELENQLDEHELSPDDIGYILHTHLHIDHAGQDDQFPLETTVVINRRELEHSVSGLMGEQYPPEDIKHLVDRLHAENALELLDLEMTGEETVIPGVKCVPAGGHTEGSMNVHVETEEGTAVICGDVLYDIHHQMIDPHPPANSNRVGVREFSQTGNHSPSVRSEKGAIKRAVSETFVLPIHDRPARVDARGQVVSRLPTSIPGEEIPPEETDLPQFKLGENSPVEPM